MINVNGDKVLDSFTKKDSTLLENAIALRRLEEIKSKLLSIEYVSDIEIEKKDEEDEE